MLRRLEALPTWVPEGLRWAKSPSSLGRMCNISKRESTTVQASSETIGVIVTAARPRLILTNVRALLNLTVFQKHLSF